MAQIVLDQQFCIKVFFRQFHPKLPTVSAKFRTSKTRSKMKIAFRINHTNNSLILVPQNLSSAVFLTSSCLCILLSLLIKARKNIRQFFICGSALLDFEFFFQFLCNYFFCYLNY